MMPSHHHSISHTHPLNGTNASTSSTGSHSHNTYYKRTNITVNNSGNTHVFCASSNGGSGPSSLGLAYNSNHAHSLSGNTGAASSSSSGNAGGTDMFIPYHYSVNV